MSFELVLKSQQYCKSYQLKMLVLVLVPRLVSQYCKTTKQRRLRCRR